MFVKYHVIVYEYITIENNDLYRSNSVAVNAIHDNAGDVSNPPNVIKYNESLK